MSHTHCSVSEMLLYKTFVTRSIPEQDFKNLMDIAPGSLRENIFIRVCVVMARTFKAIPREFSGNRFLVFHMTKRFVKNEQRKLSFVNSGQKVNFLKISEADYLKLVRPLKFETEINASYFLTVCFNKRSRLSRT